MSLYQVETWAALVFAPVQRVVSNRRKVVVVVVVESMEIQKNSAVAVAVAVVVVVVGVLYSNFLYCCHSILPMHPDLPFA